MAEKEVKSPAENQPVQQPPAVEVPAPIVPDLNVSGTKPPGQITLKIWLFILILLLLMAPYYFIYLFGVKSGQPQINLYDMKALQLKNRFSNPSYPILDLQVNLTDKNPKQYVDLSLNLILREDMELSECSAREAVLRDLLIYILSGYSASELSSPAELNKLKRLIKDEINAILSESRVTDIYFAKFNLKMLQPEKVINNQ